MAASTKMIVPAIKGTFLCPCSGKVLEMRGHYGWIQALQPIDHAVGLSKNEGHVYVSVKDVKAGVSIVAGDEVSFFLYVDAQGLGAESVSVTARAPVVQSAPTRFSSMSAAAVEFIPAMPQRTTCLSADASEFVPGGKSDDGRCHGMRVEAPEFVPPSGASVSVPLVGLGLGGTSFAEVNAGYFADDSSDEGSAEEDEDEEDDGDSDVELDPKLDVVIVRAPLKAWQKFDASPAASTSASDESEPEDALAGFPLPCGFRPPPGLSLMAAR